MFHLCLKIKLSSFPKTHLWRRVSPSWKMAHFFKNFGIINISRPRCQPVPGGHAWARGVNHGMHMLFDVSTKLRIFLLILQEFRFLQATTKLGFTPRSCMRGAVSPPPSSFSPRKADWRILQHGRTNRQQADKSMLKIWAFHGRWTKIFSWIVDQMNHSAPGSAEGGHKHPTLLADSDFPEV